MEMEANFNKKLEMLAQACLVNSAHKFYGQTHLSEKEKAALD